MPVLLLDESHRIDSRKPWNGNREAHNDRAAIHNPTIGRRRARNRLGRARSSMTALPRDHRGRPMLPAAHIKGLMREELRALGKVLSQDSLSGLVLGLPGQREQQSGEEAAGQSGQESRCRFTDATLQVGASLTTGSVTRTAIHPCSGTAKDMSLRTTERIPADTMFHGRLLIDAAPGSREDLAARLALLSISAVGGGRTRGSGRCLIRIYGEARSPGALLRSLADASPSSRPVAANISSDPGDESVLLRLVFRADGPICCPDRPVGTGVIRSGFAIPASAVQGGLADPP